MAKYPCVACGKDITATKNDRYRSHSDDGDPCEMSSGEIPEHVLAAGPVDGMDPGVPVEGVHFAVCPQCARKVKLTRLGYFEPHDQTMRGGDRCEVSGVRHRYARKTETVALPGDEPKPPSAAVPEVTAQEEVEPALHEINLARDPMAPSPESSTTSTPSPEPESDPSETAPFSLGISVSSLFLQPFSPFLQPEEWVEPRPVFLQPPEYNGPVKGEPMGELAKELATKIKETFYSYSNRKTSDNRSAQTTLGPSEIGTPCDRRLAMSLMGVDPVNAGGDGWAAFVGTCTHVGMAEVYTFANAGTGRYAVELPVFLGVPTVPRGTTDLLDRRDDTVVDWKVMGTYSLKKFKEKGPSPTYRTQAHVYALGAELGGEKVKNVAIVGLPRAGSSLDEMHVWTEKYDRKFAQAALDRVEKIANRVQEIRRVDGLGSVPSEMATAQQFDAGDDCRYCPFHLPKDEGFTRGCPGK